MTREKILISSYLFISDSMKFWISVFSSSTEELPYYAREIQHAKMFRVAWPSRPKTIYLLDLNEEVSLSLGIMVYDSQRQMLTNFYIIMHFIHGMYKELNILII